MDAAKTVRSVLSDYTDAEIKPELWIGADLGLDSLDVLEAVMELEDHFNINISDADLEHVSTVDDLAKLVESLASRSARLNGRVK